MNSILIEHVKVSDLPEAWRNKLPSALEAQVSVRIEEEREVNIAPVEFPTTDNPLFGMWRDREDMADVSAYVRKLRAPRF